MIGIILSVAFLITGILFVIDGDMPRWEVYACIGLAALWYIGWHLSTIWTKLREIQEGLYAEFAIRCGLVPDKEKEAEE